MNALDTLTFDQHPWMAGAPCVGAVGVMFPRLNTSPRIYDKARATCAGCAHVDECLDYTLGHEATANTNDRHGFAGGMTPKERHFEQRRRDGVDVVIRHGTLYGYNWQSCRCDECCAAISGYRQARKAGAA